MLNEFIVQYDKALDARRSAEEDEDFRTMNTKPVLSSVNPIEVQVGDCYTRTMFEVFKKQWTTASNNCAHETLIKTSDFTKYTVGLMNVEKDLWRTVYFHHLGDFKAECSCAMFETYRILCKHILYIMKKKKLMCIPDYYILPRWSINAKYKVGARIVFDNSNDNNNGASALAIWSVQANCNKAIEEARDLPSDIKKLNTFFLKFVEDQVLRKKKNQTEVVNVVHSFASASQMECICPK